MKIRTAAQDETTWLEFHFAACEKDLPGSGLLINQKIGGGEGGRVFPKRPLPSYPAENLEGGRLGARSSLRYFRKAFAPA
ncbi:50S ribosomal protein L16 [Desmospora sp. 8437]|nr:50S ribosomal protein L16 [Desmospora sp. 8437]